ncbi:hypothetical protein WOLCODRAFT_152182 [Wolfiporia cocos MD-104 SS10]|uniref:N-acetyltransferase domain-containing protein n=1 Tax=Wolfiporia cocos (strain MD-104) TaxID=742152 RepID=A0A2H3JKU1_WOLCO|nr:hypothetical protein WOLCODRAFT_152182 [Wolfiporia cocos MD-104 SS10]
MPVTTPVTTVAAPALARLGSDAFMVVSCTLLPSLRSPRQSPVAVADALPSSLSTRQTSSSPCSAAHARSQALACRRAHAAKDERVVRALSRSTPFLASTVSCKPPYSCTPLTSPLAGTRAEVRDANLELKSSIQPSAIGCSISPGLRSIHTFKDSAHRTFVARLGIVKNANSIFWWSGVYEKVDSSAAPAHGAAADGASDGLKWTPYTIYGGEPLDVVAIVSRLDGEMPVTTKLLASCSGVMNGIVDSVFNEIKKDHRRLFWTEGCWK